MAKFIAIQLRDNQEINVNEFNKFTTRELKKTFKCKKIVDLKFRKKINSKLAEFANISEYKLNQLRRILSSTDLSDMTEIRYGSDENTKIFVLSDDASASALAFDILKSNCIIKLFQLENEDVTTLTNSIETIQSADDLISSLDDAKDLCESLNSLQEDLGLSLVYNGAIDEIEEKISDIESDVETSNETLEEIFEAQWV